MPRPEPDRHISAYSVEPKTRLLFPTRFGLIWGLAILGLVLKSIGRLSHPIASTSLYLAMDWLALFVAEPLWVNVPAWGLSMRCSRGGSLLRRQAHPATSSRKASAEKEKASPGPIARFFHHGGKSEEEAARDAEPQKDPSQHEAHNKQKHGLLSRRFH